MNIVLIIPTGIGAEIGGHAGDGTPVAKLFGSLCDNLVVHPNVVCASDINEMPVNALFVEGSMLDRFLNNEFCLKKVSMNKILVVTNSPLKNEIVNSVSAARATMGADIEIAVLKTPLYLFGKIEKGKAVGNVQGWKELVSQVMEYDFDALAITTPIQVDKDTKYNYLKNGGINPWGGVEAIVSKLISSCLDKPVAHSPVGYDPEFESYSKIVDPRMAAEMVSISYLHCILKGLHKAPQQSDTGLSVYDIDFLISPDGCFGEPHRVCLKEKIPIIVVKENQTFGDHFHKDFIYVKNYWEAAGIVACAKAGIDKESVRRPLDYTSIEEGS